MLTLLTGLSSEAVELSAAVPGPEILPERGFPSLHNRGDRSDSYWADLSYLIILKPIIMSKTEIHLIGQG